MIDINLIRNHPEIVEKNLKRRNNPEKLEIFYKVRQLDEEWRAVKKELDELRHRRNTISEEIAEKKRRKESVDDLIKLAKDLPDKIKFLEEKENKLQSELNYLLKKIPNLLHDSVPDGESEEDNVVVSVWGNCIEKDAPSHPDILEASNLADFERAAKASGSRAYYLKNKIVFLWLALQRFALEFLEKKGYIPIYVPFFMKREVEEAATDLDDFGDVIYKIEGEELYLIPTAEHAILGYYYDEVLDEKELPKKFVGISSCFRKEAGAHGKDTKGIFRVHQFEKVEQFVFCKPEDSWKFHEEIITNTAEMFRLLEIPYRIVNICTGDIGTVAAKKYDLEGWFPIQKKYRELASVSNCTDYQARRGNIKYFDGSERRYVHTLNGTGIAIQRTIVAIIENYYEGNCIKIPKILIPYTGFDSIDLS
ncbi:MAG: serine--tRNA ligase [Candidatus Woesearchaeota archaeon]